MAPRFGGIKFNLMRAIELFQDQNDEDMDVSAPPSSHNFYKELEVASRLDNFLGQLCEEGVFDDCDLREPESSDEEEAVSGSELSTPESRGFEYDGGSADDRASKESLTGRFKRYVQRILPGSRRSNRSSQADTEESGRDNEDYSNLSDSPRSSGHSNNESQSLRSGSTRVSSASSGSGRLGRASRSRTKRSRESNMDELSQRSSLYRERSVGSEPYDSSVVYEHSHRHKHNHPGAHHHHQHGAPHSHTYHSHANERSEQDDVPDEDYDSHGLSSAYQAESDDNLSSGPLASSRSTSRTRSRSASRRSLPRKRSSSRASR